MMCIALVFAFVLNLLLLLLLWFSNGALAA